MTIPFPNAGTMIRQSCRARAASFESLFEQAFRPIDELYQSFEQDGVLLVALGEDAAVEGFLHLDAGSEPAFAVIGRHSRCDLVLGADPAVSLRHVVLSARRVGLSELRLRLWDLGTGLGIATERGDTCEGVSADGHLFVRVGRFTLYCLPTGSLIPLPWGEDAAETWASFPERVTHDLRRPFRSAPVLPSPREDVGRSTTQIMAGPATLRTQPRRSAASDRLAGSLHVRVGDESLGLAVTADELERGLLVGRDHRCGLTAGLDGVSRVHLLVARDANAVWGIDTGSTNGTTCDGIRIRQAPLGESAELLLADHVQLRWSASQARRGADRGSDFLAGVVSAMMGDLGEAGGT